MRTYLFLVLTMTLSFSVAADHHRGNEQSGPVSKLFKMADSDKDGQVSYDEHEAFIAMQADKGRERFNKMDTDGNGYITKKEVKEVGKAIRKKMTTKENGMRAKREVAREEEKLNEEN
jgi:Ca2+-binding EF-hand superfamily protein